MKRVLVVAVALTFMAACQGSKGPAGLQGEPGQPGQPGQPGSSRGNLAGRVKDAGGAPLAGATVQTDPPTTTATTAADGTFTIPDVAIGAYAVTATKDGFAPFTLASVGVVANGTANVNLVLQLPATAPGSIAGKVTDATSAASPLAGVLVTAGSGQSATTGADGAFTLAGVPPGPVFLSAKAPSASYLDGETRGAVFVTAGASVSDVTIVLSARSSDAARFTGMTLCQACHGSVATTHQSSAHFRSLTRVQRDGTGHAVAGAFSRMLNATLKTPRVVMVPLAGTISVAAASSAVVGAGTSFTTQVQVGDKLGYTPVGLGWQQLGTVLSIADDTHLTLSAPATFAPTVTSLSNASYGTAAASRTYTKMLPQDSNDIVAPNWPGVKATNPNYDANDPCIYGNAPSGATCAAGGTTKYADGQVNVYLCNLKDGITIVNDEYVQKFGGSPYTCSDGSIFDAVANTNPAVPMVRIAVIYGGQGDKDGNGNAHQNMGVFKQRFQGPLSDVKAAAAWGYTAGKDLDSLTLPIQFVESGDRNNGVYGINGYHPTEQKFPGESWSSRARTFSHACAGCHNTGLTLDWDLLDVTLPFGRDGAPNNSPFRFAAIKAYAFLDENVTCEQCHGPGSEHANAGGGRGNAIINPKYLTASSERQLCGKCHAFDAGTNVNPAQDYGFEFPWNAGNASLVGGGSYVPGVYDLGSFFDNWQERLTDDETSWDPAANGGKVYGLQHRQQYIMLEQSAHVNNPYLKTTCGSCHEPHSLFKSSPTLQSGQDQVALTAADYRNNVACLGCHAGIPGTPFASVSKLDVANIHAASGGAAALNGVAYAPTADEILGSQIAVASAVGQHMFDKANMMANYDPTNESMPVGRCTSCHMPKVAKSGGYVTGTDANGAKTVIEGDEASHVFDIIWPWKANAVSRFGPTYQSAYTAQFVSASGTKYDRFDFMPSSCSKCHVGSRRASIVCPDTTALYPSYFPLSEHRADPFWSSCFTSVTAP
ncbi:carboxypeptidase-like regulatory domain-containing protein [Anaeromyxobacter oryzae]|uniref:Cytochrome c-552/4 domain-containing protein n=1 Tax=Anaeromyxobacter oryzae TaxID=2918170 RepID=A0ABM7X021_9BACT|nr:carboxypeptidase-like regulatory domain-containing protein [Anaeromyxobacter oryzae]BDG05077.1 hypothetical protein AMOR_40730 [Anaeromyxobacter oryzae]